MACLKILCFLILSSSCIQIRAQVLSNVSDDKSYLDDLQIEIESEVEEAKENMMEQAKVVEVASRNFAASKLKQNFFKALRYLAEKELESISMQDRLRQPRQEEADVEAVLEGGGETSTDDGINTVIPIIPIVSNIIKAAFNRNSSSFNLTRHLASAQKLVLKPIGNQIMGLTNLLGFTKPNPKERTCNNTVEEDNQLPRQLDIMSELQNLTEITNFTSGLTTVSPDLTVQESLNITTNSSSFEATSIPNLNQVIEANVVENVTQLPHLNTTNGGNVTQIPNFNSGKGENLTTTTDPTTDVGQPGIIYIDVLAKDIQDSLDGLLKAVPDLFKGAKEALSLLEIIREIYDP